MQPTSCFPRPATWTSPLRPSRCHGDPYGALALQMFLQQSLMFHPVSRAKRISWKGCSAIKFGTPNYRPTTHPVGPRSMSNPTTGQPRPQTQIPVTPASLIFAVPLLSLLISCERSHPVMIFVRETGGERYSLLLDQTGTRNSTHDQLFESNIEKKWNTCFFHRPILE